VTLLVIVVAPPTKITGSAFTRTLQ
jgi:hypothetical protein